MSGLLFLAFALLGSLIALTGLRQFFMQPLDNPTVNLVWFLLQIAPLLATLPGLMRGGLRSTFFLCLASLLYFTHGVLIAFDADTALLGATEIITSLALCAVTAYMVRRMREAQAADPTYNLNNDQTP